MTGYGGTGDQGWWGQQADGKKQSYFDRALKATGAVQQSQGTAITVT